MAFENSDNNIALPGEMLGRAKHLAALGYRVFPLEPFGRTPVIKNYPERASSDPATVDSLWKDATGKPGDFNIGIATGRGLVVVDYDTKHDKPGLKFRDFFDAQGLPRSVRVLTPSGGVHVYLNHPEFVVIGSSQSKLGNGVDTRCHNGYVVAPGSVIMDDAGELREYQWQAGPHHRQDVAASPHWFTQQLTQHSHINAERTKTQPLVDLDSDSALHMARDYLASAPEAIEGEHGDYTTYKVAARLKDLGLSMDMALDLMLTVWNETKAHPPWSERELANKVTNAFQYGQNPGGIDHPAADFETERPPATSGPTTGPTSTADALVDPDAPPPFMTIEPQKLIAPDQLPKRHPVFREGFAKQTVSALVAPSGTGKTQWLIECALAIATGRDDICGLTPTDANGATVWMWNQEDDLNELQRRIAAAMRQYGISADDLGDRLCFDSGVEKPLMLAARTATGALKPTRAAEALINGAKSVRPALIILDPFIEFHQGQENDNGQMATAMGIVRQLAVASGAAVVIGHHDRKPDGAAPDGHVGNAHAMRGASSMQGITREIVTMYGMSKVDAKDLRVPEQERWRFVRLDVAKSNMSAAKTGAENAKWLRRTGVSYCDIEVDPLEVVFDDGPCGGRVDGGRIDDEGRGWMPDPEAEIGVLVPLDTAAITDSYAGAEWDGDRPGGDGTGGATIEDMERVGKVCIKMEIETGDWPRADHFDVEGVEGWHPVSKVVQRLTSEKIWQGDSPSRATWYRWFNRLLKGGGRMQIGNGALEVRKRGVEGKGPATMVRYVMDMFT